MFDALAKGFKQAKNRLAGLTELSEQNVESALREVRLSLLEADPEALAHKAGRAGWIRGVLPPGPDQRLGRNVHGRTV